MKTFTYHLERFFWTLSVVIGLTSCGSSNQPVVQSSPATTLSESGGTANDGGASVDNSNPDIGDADVESSAASVPYVPPVAVDNSAQLAQLQELQKQALAAIGGLSSQTPQGQAIQNLVPAIQQFVEYMNLYKALQSQAQATQLLQQQQANEQRIAQVVRQLRQAQLEVLADVIEQLSQIRPVLSIADRLANGRLNRRYYTADVMRVAKIQQVLGSRFRNEGPAFMLWSVAAPKAKVEGPTDNLISLPTIPVYSCGRFSNGSLIRGEQNSFVSNEANCEGKSQRVNQREILGHATKYNYHRTADLQIVRYSIIMNGLRFLRVRLFSNSPTASGGWIRDTITHSDSNIGNNLGYNATPIIRHGIVHVAQTGITLSAWHMVNSPLSGGDGFNYQTVGFSTSGNLAGLSFIRIEQRCGNATSFTLNGDYAIGSSNQSRLFQREGTTCVYRGYPPTSSYAASAGQRTNEVSVFVPSR